MDHSYGLLHLHQVHTLDADADGQQHHHYPSGLAAYAYPLRLAGRVAMHVSGRSVPSAGQAMVEFALTIVPFLMFVLALFEGGRMIATNYAIANAAREGARAGRYFTVTTNTGILAAVNVTAATFTGQLTTVTDTPNSSCGAGQVCVCRHVLPSASLSTSCDSTGLIKGSVVDVTLNYTFQFIPLMNNNTYFCLLCAATIPMSAYYRV